MVVVGPPLVAPPDASVPAEASEDTGALLVVAGAGVLSVKGDGSPELFGKGVVGAVDATTEAPPAVGAGLGVGGGWGTMLGESVSMMAPARHNMVMAPRIQMDARGSSGGLQTKVARRPATLPKHTTWAEMGGT